VPDHEGHQYVALTEEVWEFLCQSPGWRRPAVAVARTFTAPVLAAADAATL
jgi:hypothetical protein